MEETYVERFITRLAMASVVSAGILNVAAATGVPLPIDAIGEGLKRLKAAQTPSPSDDRAAAIKADVELAKSLKTKAADITKAIGELAASGKLPTNDEAVALLKSLVSELQDVNQQLKKLDERLTDVESWIADQSQESIPIMLNDIATLKRPGIGNYVQVQFVSTEQGQGTTNDGFQLRRFRIGQNNRIDDKTSMRLTFDVAAGSTRTSAELRDAQLIYNPVLSTSQVGVRLIVGQQPLPLGYELERSSGAREFPERAMYNSTVFAGERDRGARLDYGLSPNAHVTLGIWNGLTVNDRQLVALNTFRNLNHEFGYTAGIRYYDSHHEVGISGFWAKRPAGSNGSPPNNAYPEVTRQFIYVDGTYLIEKFAIRGELMFGQDRIPTLRSDGRPVYLAATNILGWQGQVTYNIDARNQLHLRYQFFDPDRGTANDASDGWGFAYTYWLNPGAKVTATYEIFDRQGPAAMPNVITVRYQFRL